MTTEITQTIQQPILTPQQQIEAFKHSNERIKVQDAEGKFSLKAAYQEFSTYPIPKTVDEKIHLYEIFNGDDTVNEISDFINKPIVPTSMIVKVYDEIDPDTGEITTKPVCYFFVDGEEKPFVTSSKSVYIKLKNAAPVFGVIGEKGAIPVELTFVKKQGFNHKYTDVLIGIAK